jgi:hypothetical protein
MNKKGSFFYTSETFYITLILLPFIAIIFAAFYSINVDVQQGTVECVDVSYQSNMMIKAITTSNCLAYYDEALDKTILGSVDTAKLTDEQLGNCFPFIGLSTIDNLKVGRILDLSMGVTVNGTHVGDNITSPRYVNKLVYIYENGELKYEEPQSLRFEFKELQC